MITDDPSLYHVSTVQVVIGALAALIGLIVLVAGAAWRAFRAIRAEIDEKVSAAIEDALKPYLKKEDASELYAARDDLDEMVRYSEAEFRWSRERLISIAQAVGARPDGGGG